MSFLARLRSLLPINLGHTYVPQNSQGISNLTSQMSVEIATFASGCFWGTEHIFLKHYPIKDDKGILKTTVGYTGGKDDIANPNYRQVCQGDTDHAEAVRIEFDPEKVSYAELVGASYAHFAYDSCLTLVHIEFFYRTHDPTQLNQQGADTGTRMSLHSSSPL